MSINYLMQHSLIVKATVVETDDASINAVLHVESYLNGGNGDEYLLYQRNDPVLSSVYVGQGYGTGCTYSGASPIDAGTTAYFALERHADGSYHDVDYLRSYIIVLPIREAQEAFVLNEPNAEERDWNNVTPVEIASEEAFLDALREYGEVNIVPPDEENQWRKPLFAPLLITTETGAQYQLSADRRDLVLLEHPVTLAAHPANAYPDLYDLPPYCAEVGCRLSTPDYSLYAEQTTENTLVFNVPYVDCSLNNQFPPLDGQAFAYAPTSEAMIIWNDNQLNVYLIESLMAYDRNIYACGMGNTPVLQQIFSLTLNGVRIGQVEWSADGNVLVFADDQGLWALDLWRGTQPKLVVSGNDLFPLFVSATGRYIGYQTDQASPNWLTLETVTGETFENALVSNDERQFALLAPTQPTEQRDHFACTPPLTANCPLVFDTFPHDFGWIGRDRYYVALETQQSWYSAYTAFYGLLEGEGQIEFNSDRFVAEEVVLDIAYEPHQGTFALLMSEHEIRLDRLSLDLSGSLDGAITHIEWLPPLFYFAE